MIMVDDGDRANILQHHHNSAPPSSKLRKRKLPSPFRRSSSELFCYICVSDESLYVRAILGNLADIFSGSALRDRCGEEACLESSRRSWRPQECTMRRHRCTIPWQMGDLEHKRIIALLGCGIDLFSE
jgi:hypothetical protein